MLHVLYVDDEPVLLESIKMYLEKNAEFSVDTSTGAHEALEKIRNGKYDAVVSDYQMPEMDGIQFLKTLREEGNTIPFIIFTGKGREEVVVDAYKAGADNYLLKGGEPKVMFIDLIRTIEQVVSRRRIESELKFRNALLATQQEVSPDGILAIGETGKVLSFNNRFVAMWEVPPGIMESGNDGPILELCLGLVEAPSQFLSRVNYLNEHRSETREDEIRLKDGRTFDRFSAPMSGPGGEYYGRVWYFRDITEKKRSDEALRESAEKYRTLIESANEAIFIIQDGIIVFSNSSGLSLIDQPADQISRHNFLEFVHPDDRVEALDRHQKRLTGEDPGPKWQVRIVGKNREVHWIELDAILIPWNGRPATLNFATDITLTKAAQQALSENETKYREIFNNVNDAIEMQELLATGLPGKYIEVNDIACRMLQYTRDELLQKSPLNLATSHYSIPLEEIGQSLVTKGHSLFTTEHRRKDGVVVPVEINAHVIDLSGKKMVLSVVRDITERMKQELAIGESEKRFKQIAENAEEWIWEVDPDGVYIYSNPVVEKILGYTPEELIGKAHFYDHFDPEAKEPKEKIFAFVHSQETFRGFVNLDLHKNGRKVFLETAGAPIINPQGVFTGYRGVSSDITARIQSERELRQSLDEKELLLREIHHRVKNNLQTISSLLYLQTLSTENEQELAAIREARARVTSMGLIHQKLYQSADIATIPFMDYIRSLIDFLRESYGVDRNRIQIEVEVEPPDLSVDIDTGIPCGLLINEMVTNALKYAFTGRPKGTIHIRMDRDTDGQYILSVSDDGIGLPGDFEPEATRTLGMRLISGLVDQLDGSLEVRKSPGTMLTIRFPMTKNSPGIARIPDSPASTKNESNGSPTGNTVHAKEII